MSCGFKLTAVDVSIVLLVKGMFRARLLGSVQGCLGSSLLASSKVEPRLRLDHLEKNSAYV